MQRTAQKRSLLNKLREMTDVGGIATEKYFNPEFKQVMDQLREIDDGVRAIASGEQVGDAAAPSDATSLKDLLKSVKSNLNRREYMKSVSDLSRFHKKVFDIVHLLTLFKSNVDKTHEKFLFQDMDEDTKKQLQSLKSRWKAASSNTYFIKEANLLDFFTNIATERGRALAAWEKRYPNKVKKLKLDSVSLLSQSEKLLSVILNSLKDMAKARATRNPDNYIALSDKIINAYKTYDEGDKGFKKFYQDNVKDFLEKQEFMAPAKIDVTNKPEELGKQDVGVVQPPRSDMPLDETITIQQPKPGVVTSPNPTAIPPLPPIPSAPKANFVPVTDPATGEITLVDQATGEIKPPAQPPREMPAPKMRIAPAHEKFFESLESMSEESPSLLAAHIVRYAKSIQTFDPESAIKLFKIVKSIKG